MFAIALIVSLVSNQRTYKLHEKCVEYDQLHLLEIAHTFKYLKILYTRCSDE